MKTSKNHQAARAARKGTTGHVGMKNKGSADGDMVKDGTHGHFKKTMKG